jgi:hypothetical protein
MKTKHASELGHLIRVMSIFQKIEAGLDPLFEPVPRGAQLDMEGLTATQQAAKGTLAYCERLLDVCVNISKWRYDADKPLGVATIIAYYSAV